MVGSVEVYEGSDTQGNAVLYAQRYSDDHQPVGQAFQVSPEGISAFGGHALALSNGSFVVSYDALNSLSGDAGLYIREYSASDTLIDEAFVGPDQNGPDASLFDPTELTGGAYVALLRTTRFFEGAGSETKQSLRFVDAHGHAKEISLYGEGFSDVPYPQLVHTYPTLTKLADGGYSVSYSAHYTEGSPEFPPSHPYPGGSETFSTRYNAEGNVVTSVFVDFGHMTDLVQSSISTVLSPSFYNLTLIGDAAINARGNVHDNVITGNAAKNHIVGGAGNDRLDGGLGSDYLKGDAGKDTFVFDTAIAPKWNSDTIGDFTHGVDKIELSSKIFTHLSAGSLRAADFSDVGSGSVHTGAHVIYGETGNLYYDPDGAGAAAPIIFATVSGHPQLTASDFVVS